MPAPPFIGSRISGARHLATVGLLVVAAAVVTLAEGAPTRLPSAALGSTVLLHALRAGALVAIGLAATTVLVQASAGRFPTHFSTTGLGYAPSELASASTTELQHQIERQERAVAEMAERLDALESNP